MILVAGAGGFIGGHLVKQLLAQGNKVHAVDMKPFSEWYQFSPQVENKVYNLSSRWACTAAVMGCKDVYNLAADMGGMGFIEKNKAACMLSVLPSTNLLVAAEHNSIERFFYASSACVYAADKQVDADVVALREEDAYPAMPEDGYGWEKLFTERMCRHFHEDYGFEVRIARYHNVYGPSGTWRGGREKAPAAICRKVIQAKMSGSKEIQIWGDGEQSRSFMYVDDCTEGTQRIMDGAYAEPVNLGSSQLITINGLVDLVEEIADVKLERKYDLSAPQGVRGRNSDNTLMKATYDWEPSISLQVGLEKTYRWIHDEVRRVYGRR